MTNLPELLPGSPTQQDAAEFPAPSFLHRRRRQLITEIAELRKQQRMVLAGRYDICKDFDVAWCARFRAEWDNHPEEVPTLRAAEERLQQRMNEYRAQTEGQAGSLEALIAEAERLLQELTLACIAEAEQLHTA